MIIFFSLLSNGLPSNTSASGLESPFQPFKASSPMAPPVVTSSLNPLLGLPSPFPFLSAHGLTSLSDPKAAKTPALPPGLPPGFPGIIYYKKNFHFSIEVGGKLFVYSGIKC